MFISGFVAGDGCLVGVGCAGGAAMENICGVVLFCVAGKAGLVGDLLCWVIW